MTNLGNLQFNNFKEYIQAFITLVPTLNLRSIIEVLILTIIIYFLAKWFKTSHNMIVLRGLIIVSLVILVFYVFQFNVLLWIIQRLAGLIVIALVIIFQNDLRLGLEKLGKKQFFGFLTPVLTNKLDKTTIEEIANACYAMGKVKTGALIVIKKNEKIDEVIASGIKVDGYVTSQLLINIFEKNTPLHDGAVVIQNNRVVAATCYLPLTTKSIPKEYGTRHRAAYGMSETSDAITIVVSEETGNVSICIDGTIKKIDTEENMINVLSNIFVPEVIVKKGNKV